MIQKNNRKKQMNINFNVKINKLINKLDLLMMKMKFKKND